MLEKNRKESKVGERDRRWSGVIYIGVGREATSGKVMFDKTPEERQGGGSPLEVWKKRFLVEGTARKKSQVKYVKSVGCFDRRDK